MGTCLSRNREMISKSLYCGHVGILWQKELRRETIEALVTEAKNDDQLAYFPGRMCSNGANNVACMFTQQGRKGTNQDAMILWQDFASSEGTIFCGVFDGHGPHGHLVAHRVRDSLPMKLVSHWQAVRSSLKQKNAAQVSNTGAGPAIMTEPHDPNICNYSCEASGTHLEAGDSNDPEDRNCVLGDSEVFSLWKELHMKAFRVMDKELTVHPTIDCFCSGTTAVTVVRQGQDLIIANVGDSRAIMATRGDDDSLVPIQLTVDLKPNLPQEQERIQQCRGRVFSLEDEPEVYRVWMPYDDSPGLAMARSLGDFCLKDYGVISVPEVTHRQLTDKDLFIVVATDGVWDVISNLEAVRIVASAPTRMIAARCLVESSVHAWKLKFPNSRMDDCTAICLYLDSSSARAGFLGHANDQVYKSDEREKGMAGYSLNKVVTVYAPPVSQGMTEFSQHQENDSKKQATSTTKTGGRCSLAECVATDEWCALDGLTRVNSMLNLPRHLKSEKNIQDSKCTC
eukprot:c27677_g1_i1 orf=849-2384(+)